LARFYAAVFLVVDVQLPFWPVSPAGHGFDPEEIANIFAATDDRSGRAHVVMQAVLGLGLRLEEPHVLMASRPFGK